MTRPDRYAELQRIAEFDHPFRVTAAGTVEDAPSGIYAPDVYHVEGQRTPNDIDVQSPRGMRWEALTGHTGQYSYSGAVMHSSEYLGGRLADDILSTPGVYVCVVVNVHPEPAYPHRVDDTDGSCPECGAEDAREGNCPSHPDFPDTDGMSWGELADVQSVTVEQEPAGWAVLRLTGGPGNGDDGTECPRWDDTRGARCGDLMAPVGVGVSPTGEAGTRWQCVRCGPASAVLVIRETSSRNA